MFEGRTPGKIVPARGPTRFGELLNSFGLLVQWSRNSAPS